MIEIDLFYSLGALKSHIKAPADSLHGEGSFLLADWHVIAGTSQKKIKQPKGQTHDL